MLIDTLLDLTGRSRHGHHFDQSRSEYIYRRVRIISLLLALILPAWILLDYLLLPSDLLKPVLVIRLIAAGACLVLFTWKARPYSFRRALMRLSFLILTLTLFQLTCNNLILSSHHENIVSGYKFFPFMIIAMLAIFPLTIFEVLTFSFALMAVEIINQLMHRSFGTGASIDSLWLLSVLAIIAGWAAVNQLGMLLALYRQATHDPLTHLSNRRQSLAQLAAEMQQCRETKRPLCVLQFDLDHFKKFNDTYGHAAGDIVLKTFAQLMRDQARRDIDLVGRHGGEEFIMILPGMNQEQARKVAENILSSCHSTVVTTPSGDEVKFTTSIGLAEATETDDAENLIRRSDDALYQSKSHGRDQVTAI